MEGKRIGRKGRSCRSGPAAQMDGSKDREESKRRVEGGRVGAGEQEKSEEGRQRKSRMDSSGCSLFY
jgi:hypothetical protein